MESFFTSINSERELKVGSKRKWFRMQTLINAVDVIYIAFEGRHTACPDTPTRGNTCLLTVMPILFTTEFSHFWYCIASYITYTNISHYRYRSDYVTYGKVRPRGSSTAISWQWWLYRELYLRATRLWCDHTNERSFQFKWKSWS